MELAQEVLRGSRLALARTLSQVENDTPAGREALGVLFAHTGRAHLIGVTGAPGTGKSSLVNQLARYYRRPPEGEPRRVAIVAPQNQRGEALGAGEAADVYRCAADSFQKAGAAERFRLETRDAGLADLAEWCSR